MKEFLRKIGIRNKGQRTYLKHSFLFLVLFLVIQVSMASMGRDIFGVIGSKISQFADVVSSVLTLETNQYRVLNTEKELTISTTLTLAAQMKADDMATKGYFSHIGPLGEEPWSWFTKAGYKYDYAGENLAVDFKNSSDITNGWINSATHKANLLNENFTEIGIGIAHGMYQGHETIYVVQFFGTPAKVITYSSPVTPVSVASAVTSKNLKPVSEISTTTLVGIDPIIPIATISNLPKGEVLGTEDSVPPEEPEEVVSNMSYMKLFAFITVIILFILIISRLVLVYKRRNK